MLDFVNAAAKDLGMKIRWHGDGVDKIGCRFPRQPHESGHPTHSKAPLVAVDSRYFRLTNGEIFVDEARKAKAKHGRPRISFNGLIVDIVREYLTSAERKN